tara:strand:- start:75 stop:608 length:534 start_codon:yes stop_codon:yes gene_type:complete
MLSFTSFSGLSFADPNRLASIDASLQKAFPNIGHISSSDLAAILTGSENVILVDVRSEKEFAVSRLPNAVRISPRAKSEEVIDQLVALARGKHIVFYCSVGVRSSKLADRSRTALKDVGAEEIYNLSGGIFRWHNEGRLLNNEIGPTQFVHPFDRSWGKLLSHPEFISRLPVGPDGK